MVPCRRTASPLDRLAEAERLVVRWETTEVTVEVARRFRQRLLGLLVGPRRALWLPRTRWIHTWGMRYALDLVWIDAALRVVAVDRGIPPGRSVRRVRAHAVLELPAGDQALPRPGTRLAAVPAPPPTPVTGLGRGRGAMLETYGRT